MANIFPSQAKVSPSFSEPDLIITYAEAAGAFGALEGGSPRTKIGNDDLYVYINSLDLRTEAMASQAAPNFLPAATLVGDYYSTPTYLLRVRAQWDHHDTAAAANYAVSLPHAQELAQRQGIFQLGRIALLYGLNPANGEGLLNTVGATAITLPPDSYGNDAVTTYDNGEMALFLLGNVVTLKSSMYQSGGNIKNRVVVISPQRVFLQFQLQNIVQVTSFQRPGGGTSTTGQVVQNVLAENGESFEWHYDDTLIGKGAGGTDAVIMTIPEIEVPNIPGINTNEFGKLMPSMKAVNLMYQDMAAPMKIPTPIPDGGITEVQELRITCGWCVRPQGLMIISMPYEPS